MISKKYSFFVLFLILIIIGVFSFGLVNTVQASSPVLIHEFASGADDGGYPTADLVFSGSKFYGMTSNGGDSDIGTIFSINADGTGFTLLHTFTGGADDGRIPNGSLTVSGSKLYGVTGMGGDSGMGTIFSINTDGTGFTLIHEFAGGNNDGDSPQGSLVLSDSKFYGMTYYGGDLNYGTIFSINTNGTGFTLLHKFAGGANDGKYPTGSLALSGSTLYGMTDTGGSSGMGTIFSINTDGTGFALLHTFIGGASDGNSPQGSLTVSGSKLYGMTNLGGNYNVGTIFSINTDGTGFTLIHTFISGVDNNGAYPEGSLYLFASTLYGMTSMGGDYSVGTIFSINTDGTGFALLHTFVGGVNDGRLPMGSLILSGFTFYGMTYFGGDYNKGTIFSFIPFSDSSLSALSINQGTLTPIFDSETFSYTANVANSITSLNVTPIVNYAGATIVVNGTPVNSGNPATVNLSVGENIINVVVTAVDSSTSTYTTTITREVASSDSSLSSLYSNIGIFIPTFNSATFSYTMTTDHSSINFTPTAHFQYSTITVNGTSVNSGENINIPLNIGNNTINIIITAEDASTSTYTIVVTREVSHSSSFTLLHEFIGGVNDGNYPYLSSFIFSGSKFYGMTYFGGDSNLGTIFSINTDGTGFVLLHEFAGGDNDGGTPYGPLILSGSKFYGITRSGGDLDAGTIFSINTDGTGFVLLHEFVGGANDGKYPYGPLILSGSKFYGMTNYGGDSNLGTIFSINTDGTSFSLLHEFVGGANDGKYPNGSLILSGSKFYGMTYSGGDSDKGTIFSVNTNGTGFTLLHEFVGGANGGDSPQGSLLLSGSKFYGMTYFGGDNNLGTIFSINTNGTGFALLHEFAGGADDGSLPVNSLILSGSTLFGVTCTGGTSGLGIIFSININGTGFALLHEFAGGADDGSTPYDSLTLSGSMLYGTTTQGGDSNKGTIFSLDFTSDSSLNALSISQGTLTPVFDSAILSYTAGVANNITSINITPTADDANATTKVNGTTTNSGSTATVNLNVGENTINVVVTAQDGITTLTYKIIVTRALRVTGGGYVNVGSGGSPLNEPLILNTPTVFNSLNEPLILNTPIVSNTTTENKIQDVFGKTILKNGSRGIAVIELQKSLKTYFNLNLVVDGKFGPKTKAVVLKFQMTNGLVADGIVGPKTKEKILSI